MDIKQAGIEDIEAVTGLALMLYNGNTYNSLLQEIKSSVTDDYQIIFLALEGEIPIGFAHCSLRRDYVEGTKGDVVGYLEGIYVVPEFRSSGIAKALILSCENWAKAMGCSEFASDCGLDNIEGYNFHIAMGFREVNRIVCFTKQIL